MLTLNRGGSLADLLTDFVLNLCISGLPYHNSVKYTFESNDGASRSWNDHIICSSSCSSLLTDVFTLQSGVNFIGSLAFILSAEDSLLFLACSLYVFL